MFLFMVFIDDPCFLLFSWWKMFSSLCRSQASNCFRLWQVFTASSRDVFHKPSTSLFFSLLISQQLHSILLFKDALSNSFEVEHVVFFSVLFIAFFHLFRRHCDAALFDPSSCFVKIMSNSFHLQAECCPNYIILFPSLSCFNRSVVAIIPLLTGVSSKCFHFAKIIFFTFHFPTGVLS